MTDETQLLEVEKENNEELDEIEVRDEDIQVEEKQEGRLAFYHGKVDFHHDIDGEAYRGDDDTYAIEFEAVVNQSDIEKIEF